MSIERDKDFEQLEDIAAMMTENPGIEFENGKYVYYGLDPRTAFAVVYIGGAWAGWQAKANAVPEGFVLVPKEPTKEMLLKIESPSGFNFEVPCGHENAGIDAETASEIYKSMLAASQEPK